MMFNLRYQPSVFQTSFRLEKIPRRSNDFVTCGLKGPRPRYPRVWKSRNRIGTISKAAKLVERIKGLSNVKEEVYGALDSFVAWDLEFPLITVKKALRTLENEKEWKRVIQVIKWMLSKGQGKTKGSYYTLLNALAEDGRIEEAEELWEMIFSTSLEHSPREFFSKMISIYYSRGMHEKMFEVFADMEELGVRPNSSIVEMLGKVFQELGMVDKYEKLMKKYPATMWEYRYFKGRRVRIKSKHSAGSGDQEVVSRVPQLAHTEGVAEKVSQLRQANGVDDVEDIDQEPQSECENVGDEPDSSLPIRHQHGVDEPSSQLHFANQSGTNDEVVTSLRALSLNDTS